jgi:hypothetical protein
VERIELTRACRSHQRRRQVVPGDQVAANTAESGENWIVTTFIGVNQGAWPRTAARASLPR